MNASRRLAAMRAADVAGYSRLMGADEEGTHERLKVHRRELVDPKISEHSGRIVKTGIPERRRRGTFSISCSMACGRKRVSTWLTSNPPTIVIRAGGAIRRRRRSRSRAALPRASPSST